MSTSADREKMLSEMTRAEKADSCSGSCAI
jgi:hypothetical protein